jgi:hypothetical protein
MAGRWGWVRRNADLITESAHPLEKSAANLRDVSIHPLYSSTKVGVRWCGSGIWSMINSWRNPLPTVFMIVGKFVIEACPVAPLKPAQVGAGSARLALSLIPLVQHALSFVRVFIGEAVEGVQGPFSQRVIDCCIVVDAQDQSHEILTAASP